VCAGEKIFAEFACIFSCLFCLVAYYFVGQPILTLFVVRAVTHSPFLCTPPIVPDFLSAHHINIVRLASSLQTLKEFFGINAVLLLLVVVIIGGCSFGMYVRAKCRKVCCTSEDDSDGEGSA
jgi:hypothetical protein